MRYLLISSLLVSATSWAQGADYYVASKGLDSNPGTLEEPFQTIGKAAQLMQPGDRCLIREGVYRETIKLTRSGEKDKPITYARYKEERVTVDGSDPVIGPWVKDQTGIWKTKFSSNGPIEAIFCGGRMMMEARWPNCTWEDNWNADQKWALTGTVVHHNWLHDISGIGFRVDIQGRGITLHHNLVWNVTVGCKLQGYQLAVYNNTVLTHDANGGFIVVFEPDALPAELAGWRVQNNVALAFFDRLSLRNDPRKTQREFVLPLATVEGSADHNVVVLAENQWQLFVDPSAYDFRPKPTGPLAGKGVAIGGFATANPSSPPSIGALEPNTIPWRAGADWMIDNRPVPQSPAEATTLAKQLRPISIPLIKHNRRYDDQ